jgi:hypothetical protein
MEGNWSRGTFRKSSVNFQFLFWPCLLISIERYYHSSSCAIRSGIACYNIAHKFVFDAALLKSGENEIVLSLPPGAKVKETAQLAGQFYVQYDALRLEVE